MEGPLMNGRSLLSFMNVPADLEFTKQYSVRQIIHNGVWCVPQAFKILYPVVAHEILEVQISDLDGDVLVWEGSLNGDIIVKEAYDCYREKKLIIQWKKSLWQSFNSTQNFDVCMENSKWQGSNRHCIVQKECNSFSNMHWLHLWNGRGQQLFTIVLQYQE